MISGWRDQAVFRWISNEGLEMLKNGSVIFLDSRWVLTPKDTRDPPFKGRAVLKGPTVGPASLRVWWYTALGLPGEVESSDIKQAFLRSPMETVTGVKVLMRPLTSDGNTSIEQGGFWLLERAAYGLNDAPLAWYLTLRRTMEEQGWHALRTHVSASAATPN